MDEEILEQEEQDAQQQSRYTPRPKWQIWGARIALILFVLLLIMYYTNLMRGGM